MPTVLRIVTRLNRGGPLRQLSALVPGLAAHGWTGPVAFGRVEPGESDGRRELAGADLRPLATLQRGLAPALDLRALRDLLAVARATRPDLIHTHMGKAGALGRLVAKRLGLPAVHTIHGHHFDAPGRRGRLAVLAERRLGRLTTRAIVLSPRQRRDVVELHQVLPSEKVSVVGPGLDMLGFRASAGGAPGGDGAGAAQALDWLESDRPTFVWCARFVRVKDPLLMLEAVERAGAPWRLVMVGGGPLLERTRRRVVRRGLLERLAFTGEVVEPGPWLARARALVLSSRSEGAPLAILEAYALGLPVVVPTVGGIADLVGHGEEGLWVPPGDPAALAATLDRLSIDDALAQRLAAGSAAAATRYDGGLLAERTAAVYAEVLAGSTGLPGGRRAVGR